MSQNNHLIHPLIHQGTSQTERLLASLIPESLQLDDRSMQDLIVTAYRYAGLLHYYDEDNQRDGDWRCFWEVEALTYLAVLAELDIEVILQQFNALEIGFAQDLDEGAGGPFDEGGEDITNYYDQTAFIYSLAQQIDRAMRELPEEIVLKREIRGMIDKRSIHDGENLVDALRQLIAIHKATYYDEHGVALPHTYYADFLGGSWGLADSNAFDAIKFESDFDRYTMRALFRQFYDVLLRIRRRAQYWFDELISQPQLHQPHIALFLTFLRLFRHAQNSLNTLTGRQLDYYYNEVLCLQGRGAVPDEVYLIVELAKGFEEHLLAEETRLLAGKDSNGRPLYYEVVDEWVVRNAQIKEIKNTHFDLCQFEGSGRILASSDVKVAYENGEILPNEDVSSYRGMGDDAHLPSGAIGFAVASPQLILREGRRLVDIILDTETITASGLNAKYFSLEYSTQEAWHPVKYVGNLEEQLSLSFGTGDESITIPEGIFDIRFDVNSIHIRCLLERDDPPVEAFIEDTELPDLLATSWPVFRLKILPYTAALHDGDGDLQPSYLYQALRLVEVNQIRIDVDVKEIKENLIIQSDQGVFDGTQKIYPFGAMPEKGAHFYIGSTEIFQKPLADLDVHFDWIAPPEDFSDHYADYDAVGYPFVSPGVQIAFIDKAQTPVPQQITREGTVGSDFIVKGIVSEFRNGDPLAGVNVEAIGVNIAAASAVTDAEGRFSVVINDGINLGTALSVILPGSEYEPLENVLIDNASFLNITLFPKKRIFGAFDGTLRGQLTDGAGNFIPDVDITAGAQSSISMPMAIDAEGNNFLLTNVGGTVALGYDSPFFENAPVALQVRRFGVVNFNLYPLQRILSRSGTFVNLVSGTIRDWTAINAVEGVRVSAIGTGGFKAETISASDGSYILPIPDGATDVLVHNNNRYGEVSFPIDGNSEIDLLLFGHRQLDRIPAPFNGRVRGTVNDVSGSPVSGVVIEHGGQVIGATDATGQYTLNGVVGNNTLLFIPAGNALERLEVEVDNYTQLDVVLYPPQVESLGDFDGTVEGTVTDINGNPLDEVTVSLAGTSTDTETDPSGVFSLSVPNQAAELEFSLDGYADKIITVGNNSTINIRLLAADFVAASGANTDEIAGSIVSRILSPVTETLTVYAKNGDLSLSVSTDASGNFAIPIPSGSSGWELWVEDEDDRSVVIPDVDGSDDYTILFDRKIGRSNPLVDRLSGRVTNLQGIAVEGVTITASNGESVSTDSNGSFVFAGLPASTSSLSFNHELYEAVDDLSIEDNAIINIKLAPKKVYYVVNGKVTDVFDEPLEGVGISIPGTSIQTTSAANGDYELTIPANLISTNVDLQFESAGFDAYQLQLPTNEAGASNSLVTVRLYSLNLNYFNLIENETDQIRDEFSVNITALNLRRDTRTQDFSRYSPTLKRGFVRFTLQNADFLHKDYTNVLTYHTVGNADTIVLPADGVGGNLPPLPPPPYTPATNGINVSYSSKLIVSLGEDNDEIDRYFHLLPFDGYKEVGLKEAVGNAVKLLCPYHPHNATTNDNLAAGNLYLGLENLKPGTNLSLLFQIEEGTERKAEWQPPKLVWSYLTKNNTWTRFESTDVLLDTTRDLTRTGLVRLKIPKTAVAENTMLNPELYWIRIAAVEEREESPPQSVRALPNIVSVRSQAVIAHFVDNENDLAHLANPLPAGTISKLAVSRTAVKKVEQPYDSFGGRLPEAGNIFYRRISERLRHRERAVQVWDYERLLLEQFPKVHRVKCLPHTELIASLDDCSTEVDGNTDTPTADLSVVAPGYVLLAVIPDLTQRTATEQAAPRFSFGDLMEMEDHLRTKTNLFVAWERDKSPWLEGCPPDNVEELADKYLWVVNPRYEPIRLKFKVAFHRGFDETYYTFQLDEELKNYLAPWLADPATDITFGSTLFQSQIIAFIESREYVDVIGDFELYKAPAAYYLDDLSTAASCQVTTDLVRSNTPRSVLTTYLKADKEPDETDHVITSVNKDELCPDDCSPAAVTGTSTINPGS